ncbi:MAG TPA: sigma-70 family RNA polymerase sigma factor [Armatimonadota bacterium]|nr:sigma-70 family RNA polymerase sigma factor [Armatimonadota bacterium]
MAGRPSYNDQTVAHLLEAFHRTGEAQYRDAVVEHMRPLVEHLARRFAGREPVEDLESEGFVGLIRAVDRFTPGRGTRFSTFATHLVAGQMRHYLRDRGHLIRQPAWLQELNTRVQRTAAELEQRLQRAPTTAELAAATNLTEEGIEELAAARQWSQTIRMESADADDDDFLVVDPEKFRSRDYVTLQLPIEDRIVLEGALDKLKELERNVLYHFFYHDYNQSEIARKLGISCNYAGYVLRRGLKHMREGLPGEAPTARASESGMDSTVLDAATGTYTREHFSQRLSEEVSRAQRYGHSVSVCCLRLPPDSSDTLLRKAADLLRAKTRRMDVIGRTGNTELGVIFPDTGVIAGRVADRLAEQLHEAVTVTVQVAAATYPDAGKSAREVYSLAREAALPIGAARALSTTAESGIPAIAGRA